MSYELIVQSEAIIEIKNAFEWHEYRQAGKGYELIEEIEAGYEKLSKHPHHYTAINKKYRRLRIDRFPYMLIYEIEDDQVIINAFRHMKQKPKF